jgi:hypothetical protein
MNENELAERFDRDVDQMFMMSRHQLNTGKSLIWRVR